MSDPISPEGIDRLRRAMTDRMDRGELPGLVMVVADRDSAHVEALGKTAFDGGEPMRRDTPFRLASVTKPVLATAAMMLVDDGVFALDDPIDRWLPEVAGQRVLARIDGPVEDTVPARRPITVEDLLTFRMGHGMVAETNKAPYPVVRAAEALHLALGEPDPRTPHDPDTWMTLFGTLPLMSQPGTDWRYNTGSLVLGVLMARAAGAPLGDVMRDRLFAPLGMGSTGFWLPPELAARLPSHYMTDAASGALELRPVSTPGEWSRPPAFPSGAAGLASTADDLLAFGRLLLNHGVHGGQRLMSEASVAAMTRHHLTPEQITSGGIFLSKQGWGYGMGVAVAPDEVSEVPGRYGWPGGYGTLWFNDPVRGRIAILLTQVSDVLFNGTIDEFGRLALAA